MATATLCLEILRKLLKKTQNILCNKTKKTKTKQELTSSNFSVADFASASSFSFLNKEKNNKTKKSLQFYFYHQTCEEIYEV